MRLSKLFVLIGSIFLIVIMSGCQAGTPAPTATQPMPTEPVMPTSTSLPEPTQTATTESSKALVVCTQDEPETLYIYGGSSRSMWSVLEAVYDGPFDTRGFSAEPVILEKIPSLSDGDAVITPVSLQAGDSVVDSSGNLTALQPGITVLPSGCTKPDCAVTWDGVSQISVDQMVVTFKLKEGLMWSDGQSLKASDSTFSYALAADPGTPSSKTLTDRTYSYKALDDRTTVWTGIPGYYDQNFGEFFWLPLPEHQLGTMAASAILNDASATRSPLGWGPYVIQEWISGDHITLNKNSNYFRAGEGLPYFDTLVFRFVGQAADGNLSALLAGECDVVDQNSQFLPMFQDLLSLETQNKLKTYVGQGPEWEHLDFGIVPAGYDDGYQSGVDRTNLFGDVRVRQAFAYCIDRQTIIDKYLFRRSDVPSGYLPSSHPLLASDLTQYPYNPDQGKQLLDESGWKDQDNDPATPRVSAGVSGVPDGMPLAVTYMTSQAALRTQVSQAVASMLSGCGVQVSLQPMDPGSLYSPGPDGVIFGRKFDLVQFSWEASSRTNCLLYASNQIPVASNNWVGVNVTGFSNAEYDAACSAAYWSRSSDADYVERNAQAQKLYTDQLPSIPLYFYPKIAISRADLCGVEMDVTARSILWNIESINYGAGCP